MRRRRRPGSISTLNRSRQWQSMYRARLTLTRYPPCRLHSAGGRPQRLVCLKMREEFAMKRNGYLTLAAMAILAIALFVTSACKSGGMAVTTRGQFLKINIIGPKDLPEAGDDNVDVVVSNRGVNNIKNILVDVELPSQLVVLDQTNDRGVTADHIPGSNLYHFTIPKLDPARDAKLRFHVRTAFGTMRETGSVKVTAWQTDLPGDKLVETATIK